jgi:hypothetical protein
MSTNFYGYRAGESHVHDRGVHLAQSAIGWEMLLQARPEDGITDIHSWLRQLDTFEVIRDEYGRELSVDELLEWVENRLGRKNRITDSSMSDYRQYTRQMFRSGGAAFASYRFS